MLDYPDPVRITRTAAGTKKPNSGWATAPGTPEVLFDGLADVQDGAEALALVAGDAGERVDAGAVVFLPPSGAEAFTQVRIGDQIETPVGTGTVVKLMRTDAAVAVRVTRSAAAEPIIL